MCDAFRKEFRRRNLLLDISNFRVFASSPWLPVRGFIIYRVVLALYTTVWTAVGVFERRGDGVKWLIFLTNWSYTFLNLHCIVSTIIVVCYHCTRQERSQQEDDNEPDDVATVTNATSRFLMACKASWVIYNIAANVAFPVTAMYWGLVHIPGSDFDSVTFNAHALNSVIVVLDTMISCIPVKLLHIIYPVMFIASYEIFSIIYWACGGTDPDNKPYIYPALDYGGHPQRAALTVCLFVFVGNVLSQLFIFGLYQLRVWLKSSRHTVAYMGDI